MAEYSTTDCAATELATESLNMTRSSFGGSFGASAPIDGRGRMTGQGCTSTLRTPSGAPKYGSQAVSSSPRAPLNQADEIRALRAHNEQLQRQLALKDQGLERLRQKVHERALMLSHQQAADVQQTRREAGSIIGELEKENAKLRADLAHRTSQLHSAVTRIGALKSRIDDLILQNDELTMKNERAKAIRVAAKQRKRALKDKDKAPGKEAQREAMASLLGTQDNMLNLIESLSFLPPTDDDAEAALQSRSPAAERRQVKQRSPEELRAHRDAIGNRLAETYGGQSVASSRRAPAPSVCATPRPSSYAAGAATTARAAPIGSAAPTRPRPAAAAAEDGAAENDLSAVASAAFGVPPASSRTGKVVEATNVSIARRAVPAISWTGDRASSRGDAHARLAAFEGRFGAPERMQDYNEADGSAEASEPTPVCVRNAWPSSTQEQARE